MKEQSQKLFTIQMLSQLSGVSAHTIRAWERRYKTVTPQRQANGYRLYDLNDVQKVKILGLLTARGYNIGQLAKLNLTQLSSMLPSTTEMKEATAEERAVKSAVEMQNMVERFLEPLRKMDLVQLNREVIKARAATNVRDLVLRVAPQVLQTIGDLVDQDELTIAQEHSVTSMLRDHLGQIFQLLYPLQTKPITMILTTPEGNLHEFGVLIAAILARLNGLTVHYLGPNMPVEDVLGSTTSLNASIVTIGVKDLDEKHRPVSPERYVSKLIAKLPRSTTAWVGGDIAMEGIVKPLREKAKYLATLNDFEVEVSKF